MDNTIAIYGAGGHGRVVADIARALGYRRIVMIDDGPNGHPDFDTFARDTDRKIPVALGVGENRVRRAIYARIRERGFDVATLIHPGAVVSPSAAVGEGCVVMPLCVINSEARIETGAILNSGCVVEHDCRIGAFAHISPNASLAGGVRVGEESHVGIGATVLPGVAVGMGSVLGAGSVLLADLPPHTVAAGVPAAVVRASHE